ncbi:hypothetical protein C9374_006650 [Naegleria lovaniensis]|uniref:Uncharacterized protein n=1 Tax=Naegleria lovaniensis TaxID=51637 RepID=A0AA88GJ51_NAELO|nr:uncharacterized protein C9374_006650 [Naegleria lovaniensis]KAG2379533.1 hypothetical protein C9374_006650 [Naegleria lovaniensis]
MFLVFPRSSDIKFDSNMKPEMSVDEATANRMRVASRTILSSESAEKDASMIDVSIDSTQSIVVDDEFKKNVADIYSSFAELRQAAENESAKQPENGEANNESTTPVSAQEQAGMDLASQINVVFDSDKISLTFPKSVLVKNEEADDAMVDETQSNATTDGKISLLSTRLLREICRVVRQ